MTKQNPKNIKPLKTAIFPVAGLGTRFLPASKVVPKELLPLIDKPLLQYAVEEAKAVGVEKFIFITGRGKNAIQDHFDSSFELEKNLEDRHKADELARLRLTNLTPGSAIFTRQQDPLGLGHAVWCARHFIQRDEAVAVLLPDDFILSSQTCLEQMVEVYNETGGNIIATVRVPRTDTSKYGILNGSYLSEKIYKISEMVEKPEPEAAPSDLAIIGRYILQPEIFDTLDTAEPGQAGEIQLTDAMARMLSSQDYFGLTVSGERFDCGQKAGMVKATLKLALKDPEISGEIQDFLQGILA